MFEAFKKDVKQFYKKRQDRYYFEFEQKLISGEIDIDDPDYKKIALKEAEDFMATRPEELLAFIKDYVNTNFDVIADAVREGIMDKETAEISMEVLKYILIAGEIDADKECKNRK